MRYRLCWQLAHLLSYPELLQWYLLRLLVAPLLYNFTEGYWWLSHLESSPSVMQSLDIQFKRPIRSKYAIITRASSPLLHLSITKRRNHWESQPLRASREGRAIQKVLPTGETSPESRVIRSSRGVVGVIFLASFLIVKLTNWLQEKRVYQGLS